VRLLLAGFGNVVGTVVVGEDAPDLATTTYGVIADLSELADRLG